MIPHITQRPAVSNRAASAATEPDIVPKTVQMCLLVEQFAVVYDDEKGVRHKTVVVRVGDQLYTHPNAEAWAAGLLPVPTGHWLAKGITAMPAMGATPVVPGDAVSIEDLLDTGSR